ncbi:PEP-CTERM sorting domain-containing protein [Massilia sp. GCM10023247]|uniref:PEP-CTERM sorting domain-containing protein n=1 Tax=Massilia sp. GCM10023247 TaxID=3252643 RepID=UPI003624217F
MKKIACAVAIALSFAATARAAPIVLDFEGVGNQASVNDFYNGGTDSGGRRGTNYGINFSAASLAIIDSDAGGTGNIANEPSASTVLFFLSGGAATMNVAAGFSEGFSFFYSSSENGFVNVYDGLDGRGNLLASLELHDNIDGCGGDPTGTYCRFSSIGVRFAGIARSVNFGGSADNIAFDDITLGSVTPGTPDDPSDPDDPTDPDNPAEVPEPATLALAALGWAGLAAARRKRAVK